MMSNNRILIIALHKRGKRNCEIARIANTAPETVSRCIKRFNELGNYDDRPRKGRKRTVNVSNNRQIIKKRIQRNPARSMRQIARETGINRESIRLMAKKDLGLKPYKRVKCQLLTDNNKRIRLERCRGLKLRAEPNSWQNILFTDEKIFTVEQYHNHQNDRVWASSAPGPSAIIEHRQAPQSVMVWAGICSSGKTPLIFVDRGVKMNQEIYRRDILEKVVLPWSQQHFGGQDWTFQQDSAPAHRANKTQEWCGAHFPNYITSAEWPPYSPDLNPMDYSIWSILEARVCAKPHMNLETLRQKLRLEWSKITVEELRRVAQNFVKRLKMCIAAKGGHFEVC